MSLTAASDDILSSGPSSSLNRISDDCIGLILAYLSYRDITALELIGSAALSSKVNRGVSEISVQVGCLRKWPLQAFRFRKLQSIAISSLEETLSSVYVPPLVDEDLLVPLHGHSTLTSLDLQTILCFTVLYPRPGIPTLHELFPQLKKLKLEGDGIITPEALDNIPPTLTELSLHAEAEILYHPSKINGLPRGIETLVLNGMILGEWSPGAQNDSEDSSLLFPPALTCLELSTRISSNLMNSIPKSIQVLTLTFAADVEDSLNVSYLDFPFLASFILKLKNTQWEKPKLVIDKPFPDTLSNLRLELENIGFEGVEPSSALPPSLTSYIGFIDPEGMLNWHKTLPRLKIAYFDKDTFKASPPIAFPPLLHLRVPSIDLSDESIRAIPVSVTSLKATVMNQPVWLETLAKLKSLTELELHRESERLPSQGFWDIMHERLDAIAMSVDQCESLEDLCGDWAKLRILELEANSSQRRPDFLKAYTPFGALSSEKKLFHYPSSLTTLSLSADSAMAFFTHPLSYLSKLSTLSLNVMRSTLIPAVADLIDMVSFLTNLPRSLLSLSITHRDALPESSLRSLPRNLKYLYLSNYLTELTWTRIHLCNLPKNLVFCSFSTTTVQTGIDDLLPATLVELGWSLQKHVKPTVGMVERKRQKTLNPSLGIPKE